MPDQNKPFVVTDRRKFTLDGTPRPDADPSPEREVRPEAAAPAPPQAHEAPLEFRSPEPATAPAPQPTSELPPDPYANPASEQDLPPAPTPSEMEQASAAYRQTADRLDTAVRAANPGIEHPPVMSFEQILQSIYMTTIMQLGGTTQEGQQPKVDLMGARQSIDMLAILAEKTRGNLTQPEANLMDSALFEVRMGFLEVAQALARSANRVQPAPGPSIVR